jgi:hypothetical protein
MYGIDLILPQILGSRRHFFLLNQQSWLRVPTLRIIAMIFVGCLDSASAQF